MSRCLIALVCVHLLPATLWAHEFWLEPRVMLIPERGSMEPVLMIGEHPEGQVYPFQPRAYAQAIWSGSEDRVDLSRLPLSGPAPSFEAFSPGLHSLAVSTYPQQLTYGSARQFAQFLAEIGRLDLMTSVDRSVRAEGQIHETYRRFAKTIVHFEDRVGRDRRVGLHREWVWEDEGFRLYDGADPGVNQNMRIVCATALSPRAVTTVDLQTDASGIVEPVLPEGGRCLINAVFLEYDTQLNRWNSDWVSLYFETP